ncbi:MAG: hypothetical protein H0X40_12355 [Chthoniobacterales bacterium]|nr:hypothetical protein [Chthoniobacterales bacterium]
MRRRLQASWQELVLPALEEVFDEECVDEEVLRISRIELKLRIGSEDELDLLPQLIRRELSDRLRELLPFRGESVSLSGGKEPHKREKLEALLQYLLTGSVPWETPMAERSDLAEMFTRVIQEHVTEVTRFLQRSELPPISYFRFLQLIRLTRKNTLLVDLIGKEDSAVTTRALLALLQESGEDYFGRYQQLQLMAITLWRAMSRRFDWTVRDFLEAAEASFPSIKKSLLETFVKSLPAVGEVNSKKKNKMTLSATHLYPAERVRLRQNKIELTNPRRQGDVVSQRRKSSDPFRSPALQTVESLDSELSPDPTSESEFPTMVSHAGLVLLHPFLPRFFENAGIRAESDSSLPVCTLPRSAALLHFLSTGHESIYEYDLALIKVLVGLTPDDSLCVSEGLLNAGDEDLVHGLLEAAISHWTALEGTSPDGFRSSFLQRPALLRSDEQGWRLQVERRSFDMLLDYLPWGISVVKLPWMERAIHIEW